MKVGEDTKPKRNRQPASKEWDLKLASIIAMDALLMWFLAPTGSDRIYGLLLTPYPIWVMWPMLFTYVPALKWHREEGFLMKSLRNGLLWVFAFTCVFHFYLLTMKLGNEPYMMGRIPILVALNMFLIAGAGLTVVGLEIRRRAVFDLRRRRRLMRIWKGLWPSVTILVLADVFLLVAFAGPVHGNIEYDVVLVIEEGADIDTIRILEGSTELYYQHIGGKAKHTVRSYEREGEIEEMVILEIRWNKGFIEPGPDSPDVWERVRFMPYIHRTVTITVHAGNSYSIEIT